jgi:hypothetical protein
MRKDTRDPTPADEAEIELKKGMLFFGEFILTFKYSEACFSPSAV